MKNEKRNRKKHNDDMSPEAPQYANENNGEYGDELNEECWEEIREIEEKFDVEKAIDMNIEKLLFDDDSEE